MEISLLVEDVVVGQQTLRRDIGHHAVSKDGQGVAEGVGARPRGGLGRAATVGRWRQVHQRTLGKGRANDQRNRAHGGREDGQLLSHVGNKPVFQDEVLRGVARKCHFRRHDQIGEFGQRGQVGVAQ